MRCLTMQDVEAAAWAHAKDILKKGPFEPKLYGVPRGGIPAALALSKYLTGSRMVNTPEAATIIVDDLIDSGSTRDRYKKLFPETSFIALFKKGDDLGDDCILKPGEWVTFPWDENEETSAEDIPIRLLQYIGEDPNRGGLKETPTRYLKAWKHWASGYKEDPKALLKCFEDGAEKYDEMVLVKSIPVYSHCEHHLAPFFGTAHVAYIPNGKIVGLSKISRLVDVFARRLQVQERLTNQIADAINENLEPKGVAVVVECRHLCMESRGIQRQGSSTITSALRGVLHDEPAARAEFLKLVEKG